MKSACCYIRVSTHGKQEELSPDSQKKLVFEYCKSHDYIITEEDVFQDLGIRGKYAEKRPEFMNMVGKCKSKEHPYDAVIVWKFSRFARNQEESVIYKRMLKKAGVEVISISEPISDDIGGRIAESIFEIMDEYYSINLSQEVTRGMKENARRGNYQCKTPYGYRRIEKGKYEIIPEQAEVVKYIYKEYLEKDCLKSIPLNLNEKGIPAREGRKWERKVVVYILENPFYCGRIRWNYKDHRSSNQGIKDESEWIITEGKHEPIISVEDWEKANERLRSRKTYKNLNNRDTIGKKHWLSGLLHCSECGSVLVYNTTKNSNDAFVCNGYSKGRCTCSNRTTVPKLEKFFFEGMNQIIENNQYVFSKSERTIIDDFDMLEIIKREMENVERKEKRIKQAYMDGIDTIEEYKENKEIILSEKEEILRKMKNVKPKEKNNDDDEYKQEIISLLDILKKDAFSIPEKNEILKRYVNKIVVSKKDQTMDFYFIK